MKRNKVETKEIGLVIGSILGKVFLTEAMTLS